MAFNLVNRKTTVKKDNPNKILQEDKNLKNLTALNDRLNNSGEHKSPSTGFDLTFTAGKTYNLDEIIEDKNRQSISSPLVMEVSNEKIANNGGLIIGSDNTVKIVPTIEDYKRYLLDD